MFSCHWHVQIQVLERGLAPGLCKKNGSKNFDFIGGNSSQRSRELVLLGSKNVWN